MKLSNVVSFVLLLNCTLTLIAQDSLVAHWSFDELVNDTIYDYSQNQNHGTNYGATLVPGVLGNALSFDGSDDYVRIPEDGQNPPDLFSTLGEGTISLWFKAKKIPIIYGIAPLLYYGAEEQCDFFDAANQGLIIELGHSPVYLGSRAIFFTIWKNGCTYPSFCFDSWDPVSTDEWHHYVAVVGENSNTGYLDGVQMTSRRYSFGNQYDSQFFEDAVVHEKMWLGKGHWDNTIQYFEGSIDELKIYNKALSSGEVLDIYRDHSLVNQTKKYAIENNIFPNPAREILYFDLSEINEKVQFIRLINSSGEIVINEKVSSNDKELQIGNLPGGIYFVDFIAKEKTFHEKVMISQ